MIKLVEALKGLNGANYKLCGQSRESGFDCFTMLVFYLSNAGIDVDTEYRYGSATVKDYKDHYLTTPEEMISAAIEYLLQYTKEIREERSTAGDILLLKLKKTNHSMAYFGIDIGKNNVLFASINRGLIVVEKKKFNIYRAFRVKEN